MSKGRDKGKIGGPFVPLPLDMLQCPAWRSLSHGAKVLYVGLKRRAWENRAYLSYRDAMQELVAGHHKVREWFAELEHYGFIEMLSKGCLGVDGKGKAPHWRLTEKGRTGTVAGELPSKEYLRWNGTPFDPKPYRDRRGSKRWDEKQNPVVDGGHTPCRTWATPVCRTGDTPKSESVVDGGHIRNEPSVTDVGHISSLTTGGCPEVVSSPLKSTSKPSLPQIDRRLETNFLRRRH